MGVSGAARTRLGNQGAGESAACCFSMVSFPSFGHTKRSSMNSARAMHESAQSNLKKSTILYNRLRRQHQIHCTLLLYAAGMQMTSSNRFPAIELLRAIFE